jgi:hypothetical protein
LRLFHLVSIDFNGRPTHIDTQAVNAAADSAVSARGRFIRLCLVRSASKDWALIADFFRHFSTSPRLYMRRTELLLGFRFSLSLSTAC